MQKKYFSRYKKPLIDIPNMVDSQLASYKWFLSDGIRELFKEFSPIEDYAGKKFQLEFVDFEVGETECDEFYAKDHKLTLEVPLRTRIKLKNKILNTEKEQEIFLSDFPVMTEHGTFIINGNERIIVSQLTRSFGVSFTEQMIRGKKLFGAKIIPARGAWIEIETDSDDLLHVRIDKKRKFPVSSLLRIFSKGKTDKEIINAFKDNDVALSAVKVSLQKDTAKNTDESYVEVYKRLRDGTLATGEHAKEFIDSLFNPEKYDISPVGRHRFNKVFNKDKKKGKIDERILSFDDIVTVVSHVVTLNNTPGASADDIDHLGVRRVRFVGEMLQQRLRIGFTRIKRNIQEI